MTLCTILRLVLIIENFSATECENRLVSFFLRRKKTYILIGAEIGWGVRFTEDHQVQKFIFDLAKEVSDRLRRAKTKGRSISFKVKTRHPEAPVEPGKFLGQGFNNVFLCEKVFLLFFQDGRFLKQKQ